MPVVVNWIVFLLAVCECLVIPVVKITSADSVLYTFHFSWSWEIDRFSTKKVDLRFLDNTSKTVAFTSVSNI